MLLILLAVLHERAIRALKRCGRAISFYERELARISGEWIGKGETGDRFSDPSHPYARDLDLFGKGSLFELLCDARTRAGEETLAHWLLVPAPPAEVSVRNDAITDLRYPLDLREDLATLGKLVRSGVRPNQLVAWAEGPLLLQSRASRVASLLLSLFWLASMVAWAVWDLRNLAVLSTAINLAFGFAHRANVRTIVAGVEKSAHDLALLSEVLVRLEREKFSALKLVDLQEMLRERGDVPFRSIAKLDRLVELLISRRNPILQVVDPFVLWTLKFGLRNRERFVRRYVPGFLPSAKWKLCPHWQATPMSIPLTFSRSSRKMPHALTWKHSPIR